MVGTVRVIARKSITDFCTRHASASGPLQAWYDEVRRADWACMNDVRAALGALARPLDGERVLFRIGGNRYRLVAAMWFPGRLVYIKFIGTHAEYDRIDARTVEEH